MVNLDNPVEVELFARQNGIPVSAVYNMDIQQKNDLIKKNPDNAHLYLKRCNDYYELKNY
ncbi:MAG: hypothetical protein J6Z11_08630 [Candidatus Riflebacteria bacterium]|nr:hypothetical protein [Candidatus Riflebacteria bacterium]